MNIPTANISPEVIDFDCSFPFVCDGLRFYLRSITLLLDGIKLTPLVL